MEVSRPSQRSVALVPLHEHVQRRYPWLGVGRGSTLAVGERRDCRDPTTDQLLAEPQLVDIQADSLGPRWYDARPAHETVSVGIAVLRMPIAVPVMMFVPWPVVLASAMSRTGLYA